MCGPFIDLRVSKECVKEPSGRLSPALIVQLGDVVKSSRTLQAFLVSQLHFLHRRTFCVEPWTRQNKLMVPLLL
jgi:hypothetical protein